MGKIAGSKRNFGRLIDLSCGWEIGSSYSRDDYSGKFVICLFYITVWGYSLIVHVKSTLFIYGGLPTLFLRQVLFYPMYEKEVMFPASQNHPFHDWPGTCLQEQQKASYPEPCHKGLPWHDLSTGTLAHASTSVLKALAAKQEIAVDGAHDLESFVKTVMCERCPEIKQQLETIQERVRAFGTGRLSLSNLTWALWSRVGVWRRICWLSLPNLLVKLLSLVIIADSHTSSTLFEHVLAEW